MQPRDFTGISDWQGLEDLATLDEVCKVMQTRENSKVRTREKSKTDRVILKYFRDNPEELEKITG